MASELIESQAQIYEEAKQSIAGELDEETLSWDFSKMLDQLKTTIANKSPTESGTTRNAVRFFCRHYLNMKGEAFHETRQWLTGDLVMPSASIQLVLRTLKALNDGTFTETDAAVWPAKTELQSRKELASTVIPPIKTPTSHSKPGVARKLVDHTISMFNSLVGLIVESGVAPKDVFDGDRMQIRGALQKICDASGIDVVFPEPDAARNQPVTREDLSTIGLQTRKDKKRR